MEPNTNLSRTVDLTTHYLGLKLRNPLVASASPLSRSVEGVVRLEEAGIGAVVLFSLFEEQIIRDIFELEAHLNAGTDSYAEALSFYPQIFDSAIDPEEYLNHISKIKQKVSVPVIASLNGYSDRGWTKYARRMQDAGADAIELNIYFIPTEGTLSGQELEDRYIDIIQSVKSSVTIPVAVKISPYFTNVAHMAKKIDDAGADGLVLFNRFYQPDIDLEHLEVIPNLLLSTPQAMRLPLRWVAILHGQVKCSLAATSGIHEASDVLKMMMVGADVAMLCSTLLKNGFGKVTDILKKMQQWMVEHDYDSLQQMRGSMSHTHCSNPEMFERANYMNMLETYSRNIKIKALGD